MAITRKLLKGMGLTDEQVDTIIEAHTETTDALKDQISTYKADAEKLPGIQKQLDDLKAAGDDGFKEKYETEHKAFEDFKAEQSAKESRAAKETAYKELLTSINLDGKYHARAMKGVDFDSMELTKDGKIKGADKIAESVKEEWADAITDETVQGANTATPPSNTTGRAKTREEIYKKDEKGRYILSTAERQKALAEQMAQAE